MTTTPFRSYYRTVVGIWRFKDWIKRPYFPTRRWDTNVLLVLDCGHVVERKLKKVRYMWGWRWECQNTAQCETCIQQTTRTIRMNYKRKPKPPDYKLL